MQKELDAGAWKVIGGSVVATWVYRSTGEVRSGLFGDPHKNPFEKIIWEAPQKLSKCGLSNCWVRMLIRKIAPNEVVHVGNNSIDCGGIRSSPFWN
jgi:hypothetical protein